MVQTPTTDNWVHFHTRVAPYYWSVGPFSLPGAKMMRKGIEGRGAHSVWIGAHRSDRVALPPPAIETAFTARPPLPADEVIFAAAVRYAFGRRGPSVEHITKWAMEQLPLLRRDVIQSMVHEVEQYVLRESAVRKDCWGRLLNEARGYI